MKNYKYIYYIGCFLAASCLFAEPGSKYPYPKHNAPTRVYCSYWTTDSSSWSKPQRLISQYFSSHYFASFISDKKEYLIFFKKYPPEGYGAATSWLGDANHAGWKDLIEECRKLKPAHTVSIKLLATDAAFKEFMTSYYPLLGAEIKAGKGGIVENVYKEFVLGDDKKEAAKYLVENKGQSQKSADEQVKSIGDIYIAVE